MKSGCLHPWPGWAVGAWRVYTRMAHGGEIWFCQGLEIGLGVRGRLGILGQIAGKDLKDSLV